MPTGSFFILFFAFIAVMTGGLYGFSKLASNMVTRAIHERLHALEEIVEGEVPDAWLKRFQRRAAALRGNDASEAQFARLGKRVQKRCLRNIDEMIRYVTNINLADSETTQKQIVAELKAQQQAWLAKDWREWVAHVEALDTLRATEEEETDSSSAD